MAKKMKVGPVKYRTISSKRTVVKETNAAYITKKPLPVNKLNIIAANAGKVASMPVKTTTVQVAGSNSALNNGIILMEVSTKPERYMTPLEKMDIIRIGVSKRDLERLKEKAKLDYDKLAKALSITRATLINKKSGDKFNAALSERILSLADIYSYGFEVFEDESRFNQWIFRPNQALGGQVPFELMDNQFGREEVRDIIGRIDYGVYS